MILLFNCFYCLKEEYKDIQVGYLAIDKNGNYGAYSIHPGFNYALLKTY